MDLSVRGPRARAKLTDQRHEVADLVPSGSGPDRARFDPVR